MIGTHAPERPAPLDDGARHAAMLVLARQAKLWPDVDLVMLDRMLESWGDRLGPLDRGLARAIYDESVRRWTTLSYLLQLGMQQPIEQVEPRLRGVLIGAAAQIVLLDRVPRHAAINHAVEWAKCVIRPGAGKLANAVLRRLAELVPEDRDAARRERLTLRRDEVALGDGSALGLSREVLPEDDVERLGVAAGMPTGLLLHWRATRSAESVRKLAMHGLVRAPVVLNTAHAAAPLAGEVAAHRSPGHHVLSDAQSVGRLLGARHDIWVQDASSSQAVESLAGLGPATIVDLCAGQGTKTRQIERIFPEARIVATDVDADRLASLGRVFAGSARVSVLPISDLRERMIERCELVVLDVPCSNTGVLARRPEARHRFDAAHLGSLTSVQRQIIADAIPLLSLKPKGRILYSTCSIESQENDEQAAWAARWHGFERSRRLEHLPQGLPGEAPEGYSDGAYSILLE